ncbi:hypothetical protein L208DRAFT_1458637 [Tricholoma matsutake]|nr:hypothetical protein L208DRAFT_1458637 [Tricholoma matsutake 945]
MLLLQFVVDTFGNAIDARGNPLFSNVTRQKAKSVLELAREGYLSDIQGVTLYEKGGIDKYGLQKWKCLHGTNSVEGGPHGDIYRKFGALHAGPRLAVNCLTDHRTWYNLQAYAKHLFGVNWDYHHNLGLINRTHFLLNYLSDTVAGAYAYSDWVNGDLYERTSEQFGICTLPGKIDFEAFAQEWNQSANGKDRFYITTDVLCAYAKSWEKTNNICASQELISDKINMIEKTGKIFAAPHQPFPTFLTAVPTSIQPSQGVTDLENFVPSSLSIDIAPSQPIPPTLSGLPLVLPPQCSKNQLPTPSTSPEELELEPEQVLHTTLPTAGGIIIPDTSDSRPTKRRRVVPESQRKRKAIRTCRRCREESCAGNNDIRKCRKECTVACKKCGQFSGCRGVDNGKDCTAALAG